MTPEGPPQAASAKPPVIIENLLLKGKLNDNATLTYKDQTLTLKELRELETQGISVCPVDFASKFYSAFETGGEEAVGEVVTSARSLLGEDRFQMRDSTFGKSKEREEKKRRAT